MERWSTGSVLGCCHAALGTVKCCRLGFDYGSAAEATERSCHDFCRHALNSAGLPSFGVHLDRYFRAFPLGRLLVSSRRFRRHGVRPRLGHLTSYSL